LLRSAAAESAESGVSAESSGTNTPAEPAEEFDDSSGSPPVPAAPPDSAAAPQLAAAEPEPARNFEPAPAALPFEAKPARPPLPEQPPEQKPEPEARVAVREQAPKPEPRRAPPALRDSDERSASLALAREPAPSPREIPKPADDETPPPREASAATSLPSCESAAAAANETLDLRGPRGAPDLTRDAFASVLENGAYLARCSIPASTALDICAAVQDGKVVGVSVSTQPRSAAVISCVRRAVASLRFPRNARLDVTRTRFEAAR
jgi:hypothetical protein